MAIFGNSKAFISLDISKPRIKRRSVMGITLPELILAVIIVSIIAAIILPRMAYTTAEAKKQACYADKIAINAQVELWYQLKGAWPAENLSDIGTDSDYFPEGVPKCPVDGTAYILDGTTHKVIGHVH